LATVSLVHSGQTLYCKVLYNNMTNRRIVTVLVGAACLGVLGDLLLRSPTWGINFALWIATLVVLARVLIANRPYDVRQGAGYWLAMSAFFAFAGFAWRDSDFLRFWNFTAVITALSIALLRVAHANLLTTRIREHVVGLGHFVGSLAAGAAQLVLRDVPWQRVTGDRGWQRIGGHVAGIGIAIPAVFVFGGLFASADPVFKTVALSLVRWDVETMFTHVMLIGFLTWIAAGYLRGMIVPRQATQVQDVAAAGRFGFPVVGIPIGAVAFLFAGFVAIQATYFFGGEDFVRRATGIGFAQYARRGFFELVTASALVVPFLLVGQWALNPNDRVAVRRFRFLAYALLVLVDLVAVSAWWRMRLYTSAYGLTADRFYATAFIIWIGVLLGWFAVTVRRERPEQFAFGTIVSGFALLALLNVVNPDRLIARVNLSRANSGKELDVSYLSQLSADAVPTIAGAWGRLDDGERCALDRVIDRRTNRGRFDWRSWSVSRSRARAAVERVGIVAAPDCSD